MSIFNRNNDSENADSKNGIFGIFRRKNVSDDKKTLLPRPESNPSSADRSEGDDAVSAYTKSNLDVGGKSACMDADMVSACSCRDVENSVRVSEEKRDTESESIAAVSEIVTSTDREDNQPAPSQYTSKDADVSQKTKGDANPIRRFFDLFKSNKQSDGTEKSDGDKENAAPDKGKDDIAEFSTSGAQNATSDVQNENIRKKRNRASADVQALTDEEIARQSLQAAAWNKELKRANRKESALSAVSLIWTLLSTVFAIASTSVYIAKRWVESYLTYVLIAALALYVGIFICFVIVAFKNPRKSKKDAKEYKKLIQVFKSIVNLSYLVLTAIDMAAIALSQIGLLKWLLFVASFLIALVQLIFRIWLLIVGIVKRRLGKMYDVKVTNYVDGKTKRRSVSDIMKERSYK